jgi:hypothetical protein
MRRHRRQSSRFLRKMFLLFFLLRNDKLVTKVETDFLHCLKFVFLSFQLREYYFINVRILFAEWHRVIGKALVRLRRLLPQGPSTASSGFFLLTLSPFLILLLKKYKFTSFLLKCVKSNKTSHREKKKGFGNFVQILLLQFHLLLKRDHFLY